MTRKLCQRPWIAAATVAVVTLYVAALGHEPLFAAIQAVVTHGSCDSHHHDDTHAHEECGLCLLATSLVTFSWTGADVFALSLEGGLPVVKVPPPSLAYLPGVPSLRGPPAALVS